MRKKIKKFNTPLKASELLNYLKKNDFKKTDKKSKNKKFYITPSEFEIENEKRM